MMASLCLCACDASVIRGFPCRWSKELRRGVGGVGGGGNRHSVDTFGGCWFSASSSVSLLISLSVHFVVFVPFLFEMSSGVSYRFFVFCFLGQGLEGAEEASDDEGALMRHEDDGDDEVRL